ncbi:MAG: NAD-dependent epimerase/dehydratase family protein [Ferrimicrobium sp.]
MLQGPESALRTAIVTGGSGFIGYHLVRQLLADGVEVIVVDRNTPNFSGVSRYVKGEIENPAVWRNLLLDRSVRPDALFHLAARTSVLESIQDPSDVFLSNVVGFQQALEYCRAVGVPHVTFASTNAVVGNAFHGTITEESSLAPLTPYGATKAAGEMLASAYSSSYGISVASVRLTNVYGPAMWNKDSIVPRLFRHAIGLNDFAVYGDGDQFRDFVYVEDVVGAFLSVTDQRFSGPVSFGSGSSVTVNELVDHISDTTGVALKPRRVPPKNGEMAGVRISLERACELGLKAAVSLDDGLRRAWQDFSAEQEFAAG